MKNKFIPIFAILFVWVLFSLPFLFENKTPFPANYQVNFFSPWNVYPGHAGPVKNNAQPDIITQIYPWRYFDIQEYKAGRIPFWNPYSFAGTPHLANYQSAALFPLNILFLLPISFIDVWSFLVILQPLLAGLFTYFLMKKLRVSSLGSLLSSFSFMFCGFMVTWMGYATLGYAILPFPLALFFVLYYIDSKKFLPLIILSLTFPASYFSGHFQMSIYFTLGVFFFVVYNIIFSKEKKLYSDALLFSFLGLLMAMPQILPSIEFYSLSVRSNLFQKVEAIPWRYIPTLISPDFYGNPVTRNDWFGHYAEWSGFAGIIGFSLAIASTLFNRNKITYFFMLLALLSIVFAFDTPALTLLVHLRMPVLSTSSASRIIVLFSFSLAVLAGYGFDAVFMSIKSSRKRIFVWIALMVFVIIAILLLPYLNIMPIDKRHLAFKNTILPVVLFSVLIVSVVIANFIKHKKIRLLISLFIVLFSAFEMYRFASKWQSFDPKSLAYIDVPISGFYKNTSHYERVVGLSGEEDALYYKMQILSGYDPLYISEYGKFIQYVGTGEYQQPERSVVTFPKDGKLTAKAINFLGVKYIIHKVSDGEYVWAFPFKKYPPSQFNKIYDDNNYNVFENRMAFPRAFVVSNTVKATQKNKLNNNLLSYDLRNTATVDEDIAGLESNAKGIVKISEYLPSKVTIDAVTSGRSLLVLTDNYYPGWKVTIDGASQKIIKVDYSFRGVVVPKGKSRIIFSYLPQSFLVGIYLSFIGILGIMICVVLRRFKYTNA